MAAVLHSWYTDQELPGIPIELLDSSGDVADLSSGWTAVAARLVDSSNAIVVSQTDNMTLAATSPNITINRWSAATLSAVATAMGTTKQVTYELRVYVRRSSDSADEVPMSSAPLRVEFKLAAA